MFLTSNPYDVPVIEVFGQTEVAGFFQNVYAIMSPAMPFLIIGLATALAAYLITTIRKVFTFSKLSGHKDEYEYKDSENE